MYDNSKRVKGQEAHLCNHNTVMLGIMRVHYFLAIAVVLLYVYMKYMYGCMGSKCIVPISVPKVEAGEWLVVSKVELGEQRVDNFTDRYVYELNTNRCQIPCHTQTL